MERAEEGTETHLKHSSLNRRRTRKINCLRSQIGESILNSLKAMGTKEILDLVIEKLPIDPEIIIWDRKQMIGELMHSVRNGKKQISVSGKSGYERREEK